MLSKMSFSSVQFSHSVVSDSLWPHGLQHTRLPCSSPIPEPTQTRPSCQWCHPTISSSVVPFTSRLQSFLASGSFPMSQFFTSGGQIIRVSASASVLPMNIQDWFPSGWTGWISLLPKDCQESSPTPQFKSVNSPALSSLYSPTLICIHASWLHTSPSRPEVERQACDSQSRKARGWYNLSPRDWHLPPNCEQAPSC